MRLHRVAEPRGDEHAVAAFVPAAEARAARVRVALQACGERGVRRGHVLADAVAGLDAPHIGGAGGAAQNGQQWEQDKAWVHGASPGRDRASLARCRRRAQTGGHVPADLAAAAAE
jgi:hypothetical protein